MSFSLDLKLTASLITKDSPSRMVITGSEAVCTELAERFGYLELKALTGKLDVRCISSACWQIKGQFTAEITQSCVVSGKPVDERFSFNLMERYLETSENIEEIDPMGVDVEVLDNGMIPVGEAVAQALAVHATAWPRHADAPILTPPPELKEQNHPFAKLSELKK